MRIKSEDSDFKISNFTSCKKKKKKKNSISCQFLFLATTELKLHTRQYGGAQDSTYSTTEP